MTSIPELSGPSVAPASGGRPKQLIMFLHGLGADGNDLIDLAGPMSSLFPDAQFVSPNAPYPCDMAPFGYQWFSLQERSMEIMLEGVRDAEPILNHYIDQQLSEHELDITNLAVVGFSQGTMTALHTLPRRSTACAAIVGFSGALLAGDELLAEEVKSKPPVCLVHGDADMVVPHEALAMAEAALAKNGFECETHSRPGLGHGIDPEGLQAAVAFLKKHLG